MVSFGGKDTIGTSLILLTKFDGALLVFFFLYEATSLAKLTISVGIDEEVLDPPSLGAIGSYVDLI